jgi:transcriptional regulator with XRE-family HTH domain
VSSPLILSFGQCIRALRQAQGLTQVEFSERCGFYQTYLSRVENGQANPTLNAMEVMANALGLTVFEVFYLMESALETAVSA